MPYCKKCGKELHTSNKTLGDYGGGLCNKCLGDEIANRDREDTLVEPGKMGVISIPYKKYDSWIRTHSSEVEIINVEREGGGIYSGGKFPISYRRHGGYVVTYRRKDSNQA